jgi:hypothetical protein
VRLPAVLCMFCMLPLLALAQADKAERIGAVEDPSLSEAMRQCLEPNGYRLILADGTPIAELWLRTELPAEPKKESAGVLYSRLRESEFVGVIRFPAATTDFRGDSVPAGLYTMRYALMPNDGNHLGAAPNRDFLLLIPDKDDRDPKAVFDFEKLVALSRRASGVKHPAPLSLAEPVASNGDVLAKDEEEHYVFTTTMKVAGEGAMPLAVIVRGVAAQQ